MKKLYMLMIIIFSVFVISDVNAEERFLITDFKQTELLTFSSPPQSQSGNAIVYYDDVLDNIPNNDNNYIVFTMQSYIRYRNDYTTTEDSGLIGYGLYCSATSTQSPSSNYTCQYHTRENGNLNEQIINVTIYGYIVYKNGGQHTCMYDGVNFICPYEKGKQISELDFKVTNLSSNMYITARLGQNYSYANLINSQSVQDSIDNQTDIISNDDTTGNASGFSSDINNFNVPNDSHALDILGTLQNFVGNIQVSGSCSRISVPIPFTDKNFVLPCMTTDVYSVHFREIVVIWQIICRGVGYYYILVNVLKLVKETLDPFNFKLEVLDL